MSSERDYVLGTHDAEISRLGLQHAVWRRHALDGWMHAGFTAGQTILDVGCGPGYAALDLAEIVGPRGRVIAVDRSSRFLHALERAVAGRALHNIVALEADLDTEDMPDVAADGAWVRWVFAFAKRPRDLVRKIRSRLREGGLVVIHEYIDYGTWRLAPRSERFERFVTSVMENWREEGGEPDIGIELPRWLSESGFTIRRLRPIVDVTSPRDFTWQWPASFVHVGIERMVELGRMSPAEAQEVREELRERERQPDTLMVTPLVLELIAIAS